MESLFLPCRCVIPSLPSIRSRREACEIRFNRQTVATGCFWTSVGVSAALLVTAGMATAASIERSKAQEASLTVKRGMELFIQGNVAEAMTKFDAALELDYRQKPCATSLLFVLSEILFAFFGITFMSLADLWQRGLCLYYLGRFAEGAAQFREDVAVNPNDTEEAIWCFLCEAQLYDEEKARKQILQVGKDRRQVMQKAYELFKEGSDPENLKDQFKDGQMFELFYANLYAGLYHEAKGDEAAAKSDIIAACRTPYGLRSSDYMAMLAKVHCKCRRWQL